MQVANVLLLVSPSDLWMARFGAAGPVAAVSLSALAMTTATYAVLGMRAAMQRRFADHRR